MNVRKLFAAAVVGAGLTAAPSAAAEPTPVKKPAFGFSTMKPATPEAAKGKAEAWLKSVGKYDEKRFNEIWKDEKRTVLDRTADSLALGNTEVEALLQNVRKPDYIPADVPGVLKDPKQDDFFRANVALAFARTAAGKKVYEEALDALKAVNPEFAVDPASYFFFKAVSEHATMKKEAASSSIVKLLDDCADSPARYTMVATLMFFDMQNWAADPKDLTNIERLMDNSQRRLDLTRGGEKTQDIQKKIVFRLDELIKKLEDDAKKQSGQGDGDGKPGNGPPGGNTVKPQGPATDSVIMGGSGPGNVDINKKLRQVAEGWGTMPADKRAQVVKEMTRDLPPKFEPMIKNYFEALDKVHGYKK